MVKHRKNCECCHHHSLFKGHNVIVHIVVLNCQKCYQCLKCHVSGHKNFQKLFFLKKLCVLIFALKKPFFSLHILSSPRAKRAGPKGPCAESARAVTGRRCPHSGVGEDFLGHRPSPLTKTGVTRERKVVD